MNGYNNNGNGFQQNHSAPYSGSQSQSGASFGPVNGPNFNQNGANSNTFWPRAPQPQTQAQPQPLTGQGQPVQQHQQASTGS